MQETYLSEVAQIERAKKGKAYPAGCSLIALSATKGEVEYLEESGEVETRYAVIVPDTQIVLGKYLHNAICYFFPEFLYRHRTGINLQFEDLKFLKISICSLADQRRFINELEEVDRRIKQENKLVERAKDMKKSMLGELFPE